MNKRTVMEIVGEPDADVSSVPESVIHEIWRLQHFRADRLQTVDGRRLVVLDPGRLNDDQGPDFLNARLIVGDTTWAGSVEIHRASSDWIRHGHHVDPHYQPVILHVTLVADRSTGQLRRSDGTILPEVVLYPRLKDSLRKLRWQFRKGGQLFFACHEHWMDVPESVIAPFLDRLAADRLKRKAARLGERYLNLPNLDQILYEEVLRCLGYTQNAEAMVLLARRIPLHSLQAIADPRDAAAALLGIAGLLQTEQGAGSQIGDEIRSRFDEFRGPTPSAPLPTTIWRNARLRPANSPRRRILQAALLFGRWGPLSRTPVEKIAPILSAERPVATLQALLRTPGDIEAYIAPGIPAGGLRLGRDRQVTIAVNAFLPVLLLREEQREAEDDLERSMSVLRKLPVVMDRIVRRYSEDRGRPVSSSVAQGLHELSRSWCGQGKCRGCPIWREIARPK